MGNHPEALQNLVGDQRTALVINNAVDYRTGEERAERAEREVTQLSAMGIAADLLDLKDYIHDKENLEKRLRAVDLIWARGGNAFLLRRVMKQSGFDTLLLQLLSEDALVYGGYSAGICVLGPSLHGLQLCDDENVVPPGYERPIVWDGLNLLDYTPVPHYKSDHPESADIDNVVDYMVEHALPYRTLHDGEVIVVNGNSTELLL